MPKKDKAPGTEKVGYGRPPAEHQFKKGQTGNAAGRPKGSRNFRTDVQQMLKMPVPYEQDGVRKKISTRQATLLRLREKALKGGDRALDRMMDLARLNDDADPTQPAETQDLAAEDQAILEAYNARIRGEIPINSDSAADQPETGEPEGDEDDQT